MEEWKCQSQIIRKVDERRRRKAHRRKRGDRMKLTDQEKQEIRVFWWGRVLPPDYARYVNLSKLTDEEYLRLKELKDLWHQQDKPDWGHQLKANEIDWSAKPKYK